MNATATRNEPPPEPNDTVVSLPFAAELDQFFANSLRLEVFDAVLVLTGGFIFALKTLPDITVSQDLTLRYLEDAIVLFFASEFGLRWYAVSLKPRFLTEPINIIRMVSFLPFTILLFQKYILGDTSVDPFEASIFSTLSLLTVLRLQNFVKDIGSFEGFLRALNVATYAQQWQLELARVVISFVTLLTISSGLFYQLEHKVNPYLPDAFTAFYFAIETITTVGYGDISVVTPAGRFVLCLYILGGAAIIPFQLAKLGECLLDDENPIDTPIIRYSTSPSLFRRYDTNDDGVIDPSEAQLLFRDATTYSAISDADATAMLTDMDKDGDGSIDLLEFDRFLPQSVREAMTSSMRESTAPAGSTSAMPDAMPSAGRASSMLKTAVCPACGETLHLAPANYCFACGTEL